MTRVFGPPTKAKTHQHPGHVSEKFKIYASREDLETYYNGLPEDGRSYHLLEIHEEGNEYVIATRHYFANGGWASDLEDRSKSFGLRFRYESCEPHKRVNVCHHVGARRDCDLSDEASKTVKKHAVLKLEGELRSQYA